MTDVIAVREEKSFIDKARDKMEQIRQSYKEKMIDTGASSDLERKIDERAARKKKTIKIVGTLATVVLAVCPADGPVGEIATALATPGLCALVNIFADIEKKLLITGKRTLEKSVLKVDGSNGDVKGYDLTNGEIIEDVKEFMKDLGDVVDEDMSHGIGRSK